MMIELASEFVNYNRAFVVVAYCSILRFRIKDNEIYCSMNSIRIDVPTCLVVCPFLLVEKCYDLNFLT